MRPINEAKPTPLDKVAIKDFAGLLADDILITAQSVQTSEKLEFLDDHAELLRSSFWANDAKTKERIEVPVVVRTAVASDNVNEGALLASAGAGEVDGELIVEIIVNGAYTWAKLKQLRHQLVNDLYTTLLHELTHIADHRYDRKTAARGKPRYFRDDDSIDHNEYYGDPREVRAFLQEIVDEALARAESFARARRGENYTRDQMLDYVYSGRAWRHAEANMDPRDRAKILKAVYSALVDAGLV